VPGSIYIAPVGWWLQEGVLVGERELQCRARRCGRISKCGRPYDPPPMDLDDRDHCSWPSQVRSALHLCFGAPLYGLFVHCYSHICVPTSKNTNKTRGTPLVPKMCMKFVLSSSHSWDNDSRIFVVRTINKLPHTWSFAHPRTKSKLGLRRSGVAWCYHSASTCAQTPSSSCYFEKVGTREA
jgi:hypothetical protein